MQVSEILRKIADAVDRDEAQTAQPAQAQAPVQAEPVQGEQPGTDVHATITHAHLEQVPDVGQSSDEEDPTMVSPLQQEHELLKKSQGVDNNVSEFAGEEDDYDNELASMKQMAGIGEESARAKAQEEDRRMEGQLNPRKNAALAFHKARSDRSS